MALQTNELYVGPTTRGPLPRIQPDQGPGAQVAKTFAAGTATIIPVGFPCCIVPTTGLWAACVPGSATAHETVVSGFVHPAPITRVAGGELLGVVMLKGSIHYDDIKVLQTLVTGQLQLAGTEQQLKDMLRKPAVNDRGLFIDGLDKLGGDAAL